MDAMSDDETFAFVIPVLFVVLLILVLCCTFCCYVVKLQSRARYSSRNGAGDSGFRRMTFMTKSWFKKPNFKNDACSVCLEEFRKKEEVSLCQCGHAYHHKCIMKWLEVRNTCPICQRRVPHHSERTPLLGESSMDV